ncbi:MAG: hypothetical protein RL071_4198 [Pseudomonadota bacterium]
MATPSLLLSLLLSQDAQASACDVAGLTKQIAEDTADAAAIAWTTLARCDAAAGKKEAPKAFGRLVQGEPTDAASVLAVELGAGEAVSGWISRLQSDERARALKALGAACPTSAPVQAYFVERAAKLGDDFWDQRWYLPLAGCPAPAVQTVLADQLAKGPGGNPTRWGSVLETYVRAQGEAALPLLGELIAKNKGAEQQITITAAYTDAARGGAGADAAKAGAAKAAAVAGLVGITPQLAPRAVEQARMTLQGFGEEEAADKLAALRYADRRQKSGEFHWGVVVLETTTCKKDKVQQRIHVGVASEPGNTWPDQMKGRVEPAMGQSWPMELVKACKGEGTVEIHTSPEPLADPAALKAWTDEKVKALTKPEVKPTRIEHELLRV